MSGSATPPRRTSNPRPSTVPRSRGRSDAVIPIDERLQMPIQGTVDITPEASDADVIGSELSSSVGIYKEFEDGAQPHSKDGVREDMSTLAFNPSAIASDGFSSADLERLAEAEGQASALHLTGDFQDMDDAAVMLELKAGNMAAFDFLLRKYRKPIVNFMYRMSRNQAIAEELAQEVFLRVFRSRETYRAEARFSTWLYRIATNLGVNHARDTRHERSASTIYLDETDMETGTSPDVADSTPGAEAKLLWGERMSAIREHVMTLPERQRVAVMMHKYDGMDYKHIGEVLKLSESATKSLLFRAYQTLREKLKEYV